MPWPKSRRQWAERCGAYAPVSRLLLQPETERSVHEAAHISHLRVFAGELSPSLVEWYPQDRVVVGGNSAELW
jgi:hypothetical protein